MSARFIPFPGSMTERTSARALRVLLVVESSGGGTGRHVLDLAEGLLDRGCDVHLAYSLFRADQAFLTRMAGLKRLRRVVVPMRTNIHPTDLIAAWKLARYIGRHGPFDVVHGHSSKGGALARLASAASRASVFYTMHGLVMMDRALPRLHRWVYLSAEWILSLRTSRIIAVSPEEARIAIGFGLGRRRVATIPNGVDVEPLRPRAQVRHELGLSDDITAVGFVGRLVEQKAPDMLIRAFAEAANAARVPARLVIIGDGPLSADLRRLAERLDVSRRIDWLGERDARDYLAGLDLFAIASRKEGLPYVVLEAMAAGLPVVATASAGVELLVADGVNGAVVPSGDIGALARALSGLIENADRRAELGRASLVRVRKFSVSSMVNRVLELYLNVAARRAERYAGTSNRVRVNRL